MHGYSLDSFGEILISKIKGRVSRTRLLETIVCVSPA